MTPPLRTDVTLDLPGGSLTAYLARPETSVPSPGVLVIHEAWGLNGDIRAIADRFASNGYVALAPDLIDGGWRCLLRVFRELSRGSGRSVDRARECLVRLAGLDGVDANRIAVAGFCLGGGFALLLGAEPTVKAIAPSYGRVPPDEHVRRLCPTVASYGRKDRTFRTQAERLQRVLAEAGIPNDVKVYPGAGHSFMNREAPWYVRLVGPVVSVGYESDAAEDAWRRILSFLGERV